jgi:excinuclease ABC subunit A
VIKTADWVVDMGPEGGSGGGTVVATGTPEDIAAVPDSHTGQFLQKILGPRPAAKSTSRTKAPARKPRAKVSA